MDVTTAARVLVEHAVACGLVEPLDRAWALNTMLAALSCDGCEEPGGEPGAQPLTAELVDKALDAAGACDGDEIRIVGYAFDYESARMADDMFAELED